MLWLRRYNWANMHLRLQAKSKSPLQVTESAAHWTRELTRTVTGLRWTPEPSAWVTATTRRLTKWYDTIRQRRLFNVRSAGVPGRLITCERESTLGLDQERVYSISSAQKPERNGGNSMRVHTCSSGALLGSTRLLFMHPSSLVSHHFSSA